MSEQTGHWFSCDPDTDGYILHDSEEEARKSCESAFALHVEAASDGGWSDAVEGVCWGRVIQRVTETSRRDYDPEIDHGDLDEVVEYELLPVLSPGVIHTDETTIVNLRELLRLVTAERDELRKLVSMFGTFEDSPGPLKLDAAELSCQEYNRRKKCEAAP